MKRNPLPLALALAAGMAAASLTFASDIEVLTDPNETYETLEASFPDDPTIEEDADLLEEGESESESEEETETETEDVFVEGSALIADYGYTPGEMTEEGWRNEFLMMEYILEEEITMGVDENERLKEYHTRFGEDKQVAANELVALNEEEGFLQLMVEVNPNSESDEEILTRFSENEKLELVSDHSRMEIAGKSFLVCTGIVEKDRYLIGTCTDLRGYVIALKVKYANTAARKALMDGLAAWELIAETETETGTVETDPGTQQTYETGTAQSQAPPAQTPAAQTPAVSGGTVDESANSYLTDPNGTGVGSQDVTPGNTGTDGSLQQGETPVAQTQQTPSAQAPTLETSAAQSQSGGSVLSGFSLPDSFSEGEVIG